MTLEEAQLIGQEEEARWKESHTLILEGVRKSQNNFDSDRKLARALTSEIVASTRAEDKAQLASDEAVAHGLTKLRKDQTEELDDLVEQPYFARVVTEEAGRDVEFRLGTTSFPELRIIDWRKAPISKLYYDYKEGDEFDDVIQGRERWGVIKLRRSYQGKEDKLFVIETSQGVVRKEADGWKLDQKGVRSRSDDHDGHLPPILSLITPDQFELITKDAKKPIVIQGIAGSGKTTVALHRLAWLLHEDNSSAKSEKCLVVTFNRSLKAYIETTLPELNIRGVGIQTFHQWVNQLTTELVGPRRAGTFKKTRDLELFKSSSVCLHALQQYVEKHPERNTNNAIENLLGFFAFLTTQTLDVPKWESIRQVLKEQVLQKALEPQDDPLILNLIYLEHGYYPSRIAKNFGVCDHIVIDEAQDFGVVEIRALLNAIDQNRTVTIVGDMAQKIVMGRQFNSWQEVLQDAGFEDTTPIALTVSHRSTEEIMDIATALRQDVVVRADHHSAGRHGPIPSFIKAEGPQTIPHLIAQWIHLCHKENSKALSAIICRWPNDAQELVANMRKLGMVSVRLGHRDQFDFSPGVIVTNVHQVKGLEFRNVLIVEPSPENYAPESDEERNLMYVAVTRAEVRLDFIGVQKQTGLLPALPKANLTNP